VKGCRRQSDQCEQDTERDCQDWPGTDSHDARILAAAAKSGAILKAMDVVISDLDGTLLDHNTYSFEAALPALTLLERRRVPVVYCSSKTRREMEHWRRLTGNRHPFIVENGGAVLVPRDYFTLPIPSARQLEDFLIIELGTPYPELVCALDEASRSTGCRVRGFHAMTSDEVARECELTMSAAELARAREFDEPFLVLDVDKEGDLLSAIEAMGKRCTRGGRFYHITGENSKATALTILLESYRKTGHFVRSIGIGDGLNDAPFLNLVDVPILIRTPWLEKLQAFVPRGIPTSLSGPRGWNEAILGLFS
jgi:mannosyl-3-phosphoglycerate phosphatase